MRPQKLPVRAVNPFELAINTGISRGSKYGPTGLMSRPFSGLHGMGDLGPLSQIVSFISSISSFIGIGKGRAEANLIVPKANELTSIVAAAVNASVLPQNQNLANMSQIYNSAVSAVNAYTQFLDPPTFSTWDDGRAASQAYRDMNNTAVSYSIASMMNHLAANYNAVRAANPAASILYPVPQTTVPGSSLVPGGPLPPVQAGLSTYMVPILIGGLVLLLMTGKHGQ